MPTTVTAESSTAPRRGSLDLLRAEDVAELLNHVPVSTIHAWARRRYLPSVKIGKHRRFRRDEILQFIESLE